MTLEENPEPYTCKQFGCGKTLTLQQRLFGNYCSDHQHRIVIDPTMVAVIQDVP
jgi:hypothetical protein